MLRWIDNINVEMESKEVGKRSEAIEQWIGMLWKYPGQIRYEGYSSKFAVFLMIFSESKLLQLNSVRLSA